MEAAVTAARLRFRPVIMTSLAFILGCLPLALSHGAGAGSRHAIGTAVVGGMIAATLLTPLFVPLFYRLVVSLQERFRRWRSFFSRNVRTYKPSAFITKQRAYCFRRIQDRHLLKVASLPSGRAAFTLNPDYNRCDGLFFKQMITVIVRRTHTGKIFTHEHILWEVRMIDSSKYITLSEASQSRPDWYMIAEIPGSDGYIFGIFKNNM